MFASYFVVKVSKSLLINQKHFTFSITSSLEFHFLTAMQHPMVRKHPQQQDTQQLREEKKLANSSTPLTFSLSNKSQAIPSLWRSILAAFQIGIAKELSPILPSPNLGRKSRVKELSVSSHAVEKTVKTSLYLSYQFVRIDIDLAVRLVLSF